MNNKVGRWIDVFEKNFNKVDLFPVFVKPDRM